MKEGYVVCMVTAPDAEAGAAMGKKVVEEGLAACCNIVPGVRSIYAWKGKLCDEAEVLCIMKTRAALFEKLKQRVKELHTYEVPEIIALKIEDGLREYLDWIDGATGKTP
ncbi:MAG: divalent-cation tolerance protein CutA [Thermodesulfobacteriota bacterium]